MTVKYPTDDEFHAAHDADQLMAMISNLSSYDTTKTIAQIHLEDLPNDSDRISVLMVWATFADVINELIPGITIRNGTSLFHEMTNEQKVKQVIDRWKADEYYRRQDAEKEADNK